MNGGRNTGHIKCLSKRNVPLLLKRAVSFKWIFSVFLPISRAGPIWGEAEESASGVASENRAARWPGDALPSFRFRPAEQGV